MTNEAHVFERCGGLKIEPAKYELRLCRVSLENLEDRNMQNDYPVSLTRWFARWNLFFFLSSIPCVASRGSRSTTRVSQVLTKMSFSMREQHMHHLLVSYHVVREREREGERRIQTHIDTDTCRESCVYRILAEKFNVLLKCRLNDTKRKRFFRTLYRYRVHNPHIPGDRDEFLGRFSDETGLMHILLHFTCIYTLYASHFCIRINEYIVTWLFPRKDNLSLAISYYISMQPLSTRRAGWSILRILVHAFSV